MKLSPQTIQHTRNKLRKHGHWFRAATWLGHVNESDYNKYLSEFTHQRNEHLKEIHHHEPHALAAYCCLTHPAHHRIVLKGLNLSTVIQFIILLLLILLVSRSAHGQTALQNAQIVATCGTTNFTYTAAAGAPWNWAPVTIDSNGNICISGTISATNPSVSSTGAAVPSKATYIAGINGGNLTGLSVDASGNANVNVLSCVGCGGGTQYANNTASATPTGTVSMGWDGANVRAVATDNTGHLIFGAGTAVIGHIIVDSGSITFSNTTIAVTNTGTFAAQVTLQTQTDTVMVGGINLKEINAVTPLMGNGTTGTGSLRVTIASDNTAFAVNSTLSAETTKVIGTTRVIGNAGAAFDAATGAAPPANAIQVEGLGSGATGGFGIAIPVCDTQAVVNISTATTTLVVTGVSGRHVRICAFTLITAGANNFGFLSGTGATCGTGTAGMSGGTTSGSTYNMAANSGIAIGSGVGTVLKTIVAGDSVCIITSANVQLSGQVNYAIY